MAESLGCSPETTTTLLISCTPVQNKNKKKKKKTVWGQQNNRLPRDIHVLNPRTCENETSGGRKDLRDKDQVRGWRWGNYPAPSGRAQCYHKDPSQSGQESRPQHHYLTKKGYQLWRWRRGRAKDCRQPLEAGKRRHPALETPEGISGNLT